MKNKVLISNYYFDIKNIIKRKKISKYKISRLDLDKKNSNFIFYNDKKSLKIYSRNCDHAGGKLITTKNNEIKCPLHGWIFDLENGKYNNGIIKKELKYNQDKNNIYIDDIKSNIEFTKFNVKLDLEIEFLNHACLYFKNKNFSFATDPWLLGPAFTSGWWLFKKTPIDAFDKLNSCNFIYISHNHPDHLHPLTLSKIRKDMIFITPNFISNSSSKYLQSLGFKNIVCLEFGKEYINKQIKTSFSILKSGDFREDSGLYFSYGQFSSILTVDSNSLNFYDLPKNITLLCSSFAGGASGYPLCFDNLNENQKIAISKRNLTAIRMMNSKYIESTNPKYYLPYAGFFKEKAQRDKFIKKNNIKNKITDYKEANSNNKYKLINIDKFTYLKFKGDNLIKKYKNTSKRYYIDSSVDNYIKHKKLLYGKIDSKIIFDYFKNSKFINKNLILILELSDDNFDKIYKTFVVNFSKTKIEVINFNKKFNINTYKYDKNNRLLSIVVRKESLLEIIYNFLPWEDMLIGFQTRIKRIPDIYNSDFWFHFSNVYIKETAVRSLNNCNSCEKIIQKIYSNQKS